MAKSSKHQRPQPRAVQKPKDGNVEYAFPAPTKQFLSELRGTLSYNPLTGIFVWVKSQNISSRLGLIGKRAGWQHPDGYRLIQFAGKQYQEHRLAWLYIHSRHPAIELDHVNGNKSDNRIENLRECDKSQNSHNCKSTNGSGLRGVYLYTGKRERWVARIRYQGRQIYLGLFDTREEAHVAYCEAANKYFGEFARVK